MVLRTVYYACQSQFSKFSLAFLPIPVKLTLQIDSQQVAQDTRDNVSKSFATNKWQSDNLHKYKNLHCSLYARYLMHYI